MLNFSLFQCYINNDCAKGVTVSNEVVLSPRYAAADKELTKNDIKSVSRGII